MLCGWIFYEGIQLVRAVLLLGSSFEKIGDRVFKMTEQELDNDIISETDSFVVWRSSEDGEGYYYHVALGGITLHLTSEEWNELVLLIKGADA